MANSYPFLVFFSVLGKNFKMRGRISAIIDLHCLSTAKGAFVGGKSGDIISCRLPRVSGRQLARHIALAEVIHHKFMCSRVACADRREGLGESFHNLYCRFARCPGAVYAVLNKIWLILMLYKLDGIKKIADVLIFCLSVLPLLAYPLQKFIPKFKDKGRDGQRTLAMIFSASGYVCGVAVAFAFGAPKELKMVFVEYLLCGISILVSSKVFKKKASGHACGVVGPVAMLTYLGLYIPAAVGAILTLPVYVSSLKTRRHTAFELLLGSIIPIAMLLINHLIFLAL